MKMKKDRKGRELNLAEAIRRRVAPLGGVELEIADRRTASAGVARVSRDLKRESIQRS